MGGKPGQPPGGHRRLRVWRVVLRTGDQKNAPVDLTVIDRTNYHLPEPLLYQVASAALALADIAQLSIRTILRGQKNVFAMLGDVERVDVKKKCIFVKGTGGAVRLSGARARRCRQLLWFTGEWARYAPMMKEVKDADAAWPRSRLLMSFEAAEPVENPGAERSADLLFARSSAAVALAWSSAGADRRTGGGRDLDATSAWPDTRRARVTFM